MRVVQKVLSLPQILDFPYIPHLLASPAQKLRQKSELVFSIFIRSGSVATLCSATALFFLFFFNLFFLVRFKNFLNNPHISCNKKKKEYIAVQTSIHLLHIYRIYLWLMSFSAVKFGYR